MPSTKESTGRSVRRKVSDSQLPDEKDEDYILRRTKNNMAVRKSRDKSKKKTEETLERVQILKNENTKLEQQIKDHKNQLALLKDVFLSHAGSGTVNFGVDLEALLKDSDNEAEEKPTTSQVILGI